jgi:hypothetical protein
MVKPIYETLPEPVQHAVVFYHDDCVDGMMSAIIAKRFLEEKGLPLLLQAVTYKTDLKPLIKDIKPGASIFFLDFAPHLPDVFAAVEKASQVIVLDHHTWDEADLALAGSEECPISKTIMIDTDKCGATMTWEFFHPEESIPLMLTLVQDRDLHHEGPMALDFHAFATNQESFVRKDIDGFSDYFGQLLDTSPESRAEAGMMLYSFAINGRHIRSAERSFILQIIKISARNIRIGGNWVPAIPIPYYLVTQACDVLLELYPDAPFAAAYQDDLYTGDRKYSIRAREHQNLNLIPIAQRYGGGGHPKACGFTVKSGSDDEKLI